MPGGMRRRENFDAKMMVCNQGALLVPHTYMGAMIQKQRLNAFFARHDVPPLFISGELLG